MRDYRRIRHVGSRIRFKLWTEMLLFCTLFLTECFFLTPLSIKRTLLRIRQFLKKRDECAQFAEEVLKNSVSEVDKEV